MNPPALDQLRPKIEALESVPTIPAVVLPLAALLQLPPEQVSVDKVVELASYDGALAAQCIKMANSPLFGRRKTETVRSAVMALGLKRVEAILLGCSLNQVVPADKWVFDAVIFWRHSLGCALVSRKLAQLIGYPDPEKAYLAGLLHDLGILVNTVACTDEFRGCFQAARDRHAALHLIEKERLGFTHCQSGKILAQHWKFSADLIEAVELHHTLEDHEAPPLVLLVHLGDLLCRLRDLGYGYYEAMGVDLASDVAWTRLAQHYPEFAKTDVARLSMDIEGAMDEIVALVDLVFRT